MTPDPFRRQLANRAAALLLGDLPLPEEALLAFADALHGLETAEAVERRPAGRRSTCTARSGRQKLPLDKPYLVRYSIGVDREDGEKTTMSGTILTKTSSAGQIEVRMDRSEVKQMEVLLDGKRLCSGWLQKLQAPKGDVTHHIGGKAGFTAPEAAQIETAFRAATAPTLRQQRQALWLSLRGLEEDRDAAFERGHESDGSAAYRAAKPWDAKIEAARQAIAEFDAAHPEVLAEIQAEKAERVARFERAD